MKEEKSECRNEKARKAKNPAKAMLGMSIQTLVKPAKLNPVMLNPGTTNETIYKTATAATQRNKPNVIKLTGNRRIFIIGLAIKEAIVSPRPVNNNVSIPF